MIQSQIPCTNPEEASAGSGTPLPIISIIIPAYNTGKYIAECLDSVLCQTFLHWEAICIDDGSTDDSLLIFKHYAAQDVRIRVLHQSNQGVCVARNNAIGEAKGKYIFPLDSDDRIAPTCLEVLYKIIVTTKYVAVCPLGYYFGEEMANGLNKIEMPEPTRENMYSWSNALHNSTLFPKVLWEKYGGYDENFSEVGAEDFDFFLNFVDDNQPFCQAPGELFYYRMKPHAESRNMITSRDASVFERTKEAMFAKRPIMKLLYTSPRRGHSGDSVLRLLGIVPLLKIQRKRTKTLLWLFNFLPLLQIRYKPQQTVWRLFGFFPLLVERESK